MDRINHKWCSYAKTGLTVVKMSISAERQATEHQGRIAGHWTEELKLALDLQFGSSHLTFKALMSPFSFLSEEVNSNYQPMPPNVSL